MPRKPSKDPVLTALDRIAAGTCSDPHSVLGMHDDPQNGGITVRVFDPAADQIFFLSGEKRLEMERARKKGFFTLSFPHRKKHFAYTLERHYGNSTFTAEDPYHFLPEIGEMDLYLFNNGSHRNVYDVMGAHVRSPGGVRGVAFTVWAPNAVRVSVVGEFNCWDGRRHPMRRMGNSGVWELFIPGICAGDLYKFEIRAKNGDVFMKMDPYARRTELRPGNASIVPDDTPFAWSDAGWMSERAKKNVLESPVNIYEVHLGTWGGNG